MSIENVGVETTRTLILGVFLVVLASVVAPPHSWAHDPEAEPAAASESASVANLAEVGAKLSNPVSDAWALFTEFDLSFSDGNFNKGDSKAGAAMLFQPILPLPLAEGWKMIVRPTLPVQFVSPIPKEKKLNNYDYIGGLGDTFLPLVVSPSLDHWLIGLGPTFLIPTGTNRSLGNQQWGMGPTGIVGYKTKDWVAGVFPQYFFRLGDRGDQSGRTSNVSNGTLLYFAWLNLPDAWQIGTGPSISYNHKASSGNKWNVPIGVGFAKTTRIGNMPVKFQVLAEYSVVSQDDFGKRALFRLNIIPVIPALIANPIFGRN